MFRPLILLLLLVAGMQAFSQVPTLPSITNFSSKEYKADPQNFDVVQDQRGVMYFANTAGILEFDGTDWKKITMKGPILSLALAESGKIYFGGGGVFGFLQANKLGNLEPVYLMDSLSEDQQRFDKIWSVEAIDNKVFFNAFTDIFVYDDGELTVIKPKEEFHLSFKVGNEFWVVEKQTGIYKLVGNRPNLIPNSDFFIGSSIFSILPYIDDTYLVATRSKGIYIFDPNDVVNIRPLNKETNDILAGNVVYGGIRLSDGNYAFNTVFDGVFILNQEGSIVQKVSREDGLHTELVLKLFEDKYGQLWCGLDNGVSYIAYSSPYTIMKEGKSYHGAVNAMERNGSYLYLATNLGLYGGVVGFSDSLSVRSPLSSISGVAGQCLDIVEIDDQVMVATNGVYAVNGLEATQISNLDSRSLCKVGNYTPPTFLAGGNDGLAVIQKQNGQWKEINRLEDFPEEVFRVIQDVEFQNGKFNFWITMVNNGVRLYEFNHDFSAYEMTPLKQDGELVGVEAWSIDNQAVFSSLLGSQYLVYDYDSMSLKEPENDMLVKIKACEVPVYRTRSDPEEGVWISSPRKVYHFDRTMDGEILVDSMGFLISDLASVDAFYLEGEGITWIGGTEGVIRYDKHGVRKEIGYYNCILRKVSLNKDSVIYNGYGNPKVNNQNRLFDYKFNSISFKFSAPFYDHMDEVEYAFMLEGYDKQFSQWSKNTEANYTNLYEGDYTFIVKAKNIYGQISETAKYTFTVAPPWYRTVLAYIGYFVAGALLIYSVVTLNAARLKKEKQQLETIVAQRTAELAEKNTKLEEFNTELASQKEIVEQKNKDITDSILYAEKIQRALLISEAEVTNVFPNHFVMYQPKSILSGDFYWFNNDAVNGFKSFACVDCTGHGVPGALMSMIGHAFLNEIIVEKRHFDPGETLNMLREQIIRALGEKGEDEAKSKDGMDMVLCVFDPEKNELSFAGANNPVWIVSKHSELMVDGEKYAYQFEQDGQYLFEIKGNKQPIGSYVGELKPFSTRVVTLNQGDTIYASTDGYPDQFGGKDGKKFKHKRFKEGLLSLAHLSMNVQKEKLITGFNQWKGGMEQIDDVCVIGVKV